MSYFMTSVGMALLFIFFAFLCVMYIKNLVKLYRAVSVEDYGLITILRVIGAFTFVFGIVMGFV